MDRRRCRRRPADRFPPGPRSGLGPYRQPILAGAKVRYVGEPVAVVFAEDAYVAEDAADLVFADIEDLPPCLDPTAAPSAFDEGLSTEPAVVRKGYGDVDAAFAVAGAVVELTLRSAGTAACRWRPAGRSHG